MSYVVCFDKPKEVCSTPEILYQIVKIYCLSTFRYKIVDHNMLSSCYCSGSRDLVVLWLTNSPYTFLHQNTNVRSSSSIADLLTLTSGNLSSVPWI